MKKFTEKLVFFIFALIGAGLIVGGAFFISSNNKFKENAVQTQAEIIHIDRQYDSDGDTSYTVYVEFEVDGKKYDGILDCYIAGMYVGGYTDVYYNPLDPSDFRSTSNGVGGIIMIGMGIIFFFVGGGAIISSISKSNINKKLIENGREITVEFDHVVLNRNYSVNGRHPYIIVCQGTENDYNEYVSENIWKNPERYIKDRGITHFKVYVDYDNPKKYYMPLDELSEII